MLAHTSLFTRHDATYVYRDMGQGEPLVLLHGFTGTQATWNDYIEKWCQNYRVITIDLPGHGDTRCQTPRTMEHFCEDLSALLTTLQLGKVYMLGYSLGGRTALSFAQYFPNQVKSLILESASPGLKTEAERKTRREQDDKLAEKIKEEGIEAFVNKWENIPLFTSQKNLPKTIQNRIRKERLSQKKTGLGNSLVYMGTGRQPSWWDQLQSLTIPVLLIVGELDVKFVQINQTMHHLLKHSTIQCVPNAGHAVHIEQVEKFDKIIGDFLSH